MHFLKPLKFVWGLPNENGQFLPRTWNHTVFHARKKSGKLTLSPLKNIPLTPLNQGLNRHIFLRGQSPFFWFFSGVKCFFQVQNSHFGRPKTNFRRFQKWKAQKKKKKKKGPHLFLERFPASISNFPPFLVNYHPFSLFSLPLFSRYVSKNFPVRSLGGGHPPPVTPLPWTALRGVKRRLKILAII